MPSLVLLATVLIPPVTYILFGTSSMAAGVTVVAAMYSLWFVGRSALAMPVPGPHRPPLWWGTLLSTLVATFLLGAISFAVNWLRFDPARFLLSFGLLAVVILGAFSLATLASMASNQVADRAVKTVFYVLLISGLASALGFSIFTIADATKPTSFFAEPSHYALSFLPFLLYMAIRSSQAWKLALVLISLAIALAVVNLTLIVGVALVCLIALRKRYWLAVGIAAAAAWAFLPEESLVYYSDRIDISSYSDNISVLAFMQGWERAYLNLFDYNGLGVGFQQFGIIGSEGNIQGAIVFIAGQTGNVLDGATVGAKLVGELGVLGVVLLIAYSAVSFRQAFALRRNPQFVGADLFFRCCFVMYAVDIFIRGAGGYFAPTTFLMLTSVFWIAQRR